MTKEATKDLGNTGGKEAKQERHEGAGHATGGAVKDRQTQSQTQPGVPGQPPLDPGQVERPKGPMFADTEHHNDPVDERTGLRGRPDSPSDRPGQRTRDNVNPNIPSAPPGEGGIVDPNSLGMEQGGVPAKEVPVHSVNEPGTPANPSTRDPSTQEEGMPPVWPYVGVDPEHPLNTPRSINEPPGSDTTPDGGDGEGEGGGEEDEAPEIEALDPDEAEVGSADVTMGVHGSGFTQQSVIQFGPDNDLETTFVSDTELTATVKPSEWEEGVVPVRIKNADGGLKSEEVEFEFVAATPEARQGSKRTKPKPPGKGKGKSKGKKGRK